MDVTMGGSAFALSYFVGEKIIMENILQKRKLNRLTKANETLTRINKELTDENNSLKQKNASLEKTIMDIQGLEETYRSCIEETKQLKEKYADSVKEINKMKSDYQKKMKSLLRDMKKQK